MEETLSSRVVFDGQVVRLRVDDVMLSDGRKTSREIVERGDCVAVVPIDDDGNVLLVKQFRRAADKNLLEIPAGGIDPGEEPEVAVQREMREETGYLPRKVEWLGGFYASPGYCTEYLYLYLATDLIPSPVSAEDTESIKLVRVPITQIPGLITSGTICDAKSIAGLLAFLEYQKLR